MKHLKILLILMLLASLLLTGCSEKKSDTLKEFESQLKTMKENYATVVTEYDGGTLTMMDVMPTFSSMYSYYYQLYSMFGMSLTDDMITDLENQTMQYLVQCRVMEAEFDRRGLTLDKTEEEYNAESDASYNEQLEYYVSAITGDYTDEEKQAYAELVMYSNGMTIENCRKQTLMNAKIDKVVAAMAEEAELPTEDDVKAYYEECLADDEAKYTETPTGVESAMSEGTPVCWMPEGYRTVKHILVIPETEVLTAVTDARTALSTAESELAALEEELAGVTAETEEVTAEETAAPAAEETEAAAVEATEAPAAEETAEAVEATEAPAAEETAEATEAPRTAEEIQADIDAKKAEIPDLEKAVTDAEDACIASVQEKLDSIYADLASGKDFDSVMAEYGEDPGMQSDPNMTTGYYVRADSTQWDNNFTAGAMALEKVGDYSQTPVISSSGVHIIYYNSDVTPGAVPIEDVYDALYAEKLNANQNEYLLAQVEALTAAVNPVYYADKWTFQQ